MYSRKRTGIPRSKRNVQYQPLSRLFPGNSFQAVLILSEKNHGFFWKPVRSYYFQPAVSGHCGIGQADVPGPVFFKQERVGLNGGTFTFLKFRSMFTDSDPDRHKAYITKFIGEGKDDKDAPGVYKLSNDSRVTALGRFLRKTSLDELPSSSMY